MIRRQNNKEVYFPKDSIRQDGIQEDHPKEEDCIQANWSDGHNFLVIRG
jgi:hypothetical protein